MIASVANMREHAGAQDRSVFAFSPATREEYSADANDYFTKPDDWIMRDSEGNEMVLVRRRSTIEEITP